MDPLSDVISLLRPRSYTAGGLDLGREWSIRFGRFPGIKCYAVVSQDCWLQVEGVPEARHIKTGDCILLATGRPFELASDLALPPVESATVFATARNGGIVQWNGGGGCFFVGGHFLLDGNHVERLLGTLPPIIHIQSSPHAEVLRWTLERMKHEVNAQRPGSTLVTQHLAYTLLVEAIRLHLEDDLSEKVGCLVALTDKNLSAAMTAMHEDPSTPWTIQRLAECAGMSRTAFALKFKAVVGSSVIDYLSQWRMLLAADRLRHTENSMAEIAFSLGYQSESAFSKAFKRIMGSSPRHFRGRMTSAGKLHLRLSGSEVRGRLDGHMVGNRLVAKGRCLGKSQGDERLKLTAKIRGDAAP